jgi:hypothetical protein
MVASGQRHAPAALYPRWKDPAVPIVQEAGRASEPVWTQRIVGKSFASAGDRDPVIQSLTKTLNWLSYPSSTSSQLLRGIARFNATRQSNGSTKRDKDRLTCYIATLDYWRNNMQDNASIKSMRVEHLPCTRRQNLLHIWGMNSVLSHCYVCY